jgi:hypothetical protein
MSRYALSLHQITHSLNASPFLTDPHDQGSGHPVRYCFVRRVASQSIRQDWRRFSQQQMKHSGTPKIHLPSQTDLLVIKARGPATSFRKTPLVVVINTYVRLPLTQRERILSTKESMNGPTSKVARLTDVAPIVEATYLTDYASEKMR